MEVRFKKMRGKDLYEKSRPGRGFRKGGVADSHVDMLCIVFAGLLMLMPVLVMVMLVVVGYASGYWLC